jgi:hypothetical protein
MIVHHLMLILAAQTFETASGPADFTVGTMNRTEWDCAAWVDATQAAATAPGSRAS